MSSRFNNKLPNGLLVAWYGDDFTGSAAVMEVLSFAGISSVLFFEMPTAEQLSRFEGIRALGVASTARAQSLEWMDKNLPQNFEYLAGLNPQILHYKICSTLDSSSNVGSIGRAIEIGTLQLQTNVVPILTAAPKMGRFQCFGDLYARYHDKTVRLDRHPVMSRHPVTPMSEANVAKHILTQSDRLEASEITLEHLRNGETGFQILSTKKNRINIVSIDTVNEFSDQVAGAAIWSQRKSSPFVVGSQGVEYALISHWQKEQLLSPSVQPKALNKAQTACISGSVSPITAEQINWSMANGFECISFDACKIFEDLDSEIERCVIASLLALERGESTLIYSAKGPNDPSVKQFKIIAETKSGKLPAANQTLGKALGITLRKILEKSGVRRAIISGGDTSGFASQALGAFALTALAPTIAGASICKLHADGQFNGLELALKGGQMGTDDYFGWVRDGGGIR